jgi:hypothetical protein
MTSMNTDTNNLDALLLIVAADAALGRLELAKEAKRKVMILKPDFTIVIFAKNYPYKDRSQLQKMISCLQQPGL